MSSFILEYEQWVRLSVFLGLCGTMILFEALWPRKKRFVARAKRWTTNLLIVIFDSVALRAVFFALAAVGTAHLAAQNQLGLFNLTNLPIVLEGLLAFLILDFAIWFQHWASHKVPLFWRLHRIHHADRDVDFTTALRFHPLEILLSMAFKMAIVLIIGASPAVVVFFEIVLNGSAIFNHANFRIPLALDKYLRLVIVTPDMHRVHHSIIHSETDSNYGFNLSIWDRLFKTYTAQPQKGHDAMITGLSEHQDEQPSQFIWSLLQPFKK